MIPTAPIESEAACSVLIAQRIALVLDVCSEWESIEDSKPSEKVVR